ncbi:hypothetical protein [Microcystis sp. LEGE 08355]|uniref:hypothetical protein n=1 Tax=Microcystis sp. LEGE 08355 TaxID=1828687 RepID=UPI001D137C49|nr:hypothetical protein [Microcystis sp. LEGE 08355]
MISSWTKVKTRFPRKALLGYRKSGNNQSSKISQNKMMRMFLDFLVEDAFKNPSSLTPFTQRKWLKKSINY